MKITVEFNSINEYLELKEKILPPEIKKTIDGNEEQFNLINAMSALLEHIASNI